MRRISFLVLTLMAMLLVVAGTAMARGRHSQTINISDDDRDEIRNCADINVHFDNERAAVIAEKIPVSGVRSLRVSNPYNGGIYVTGGAGAYEVTACKAAEIPSEAAKIRVGLRGNEIAVDGPDRGDWTIFFLIRAPQNAVLDLATTNGGISVIDVSGTITARAKNGPVSLRSSSGTIDAQSVNGPVSLNGGSGTVNLETENGPLSVKLASGDWQGDLRGSTQNGPLTLRVPKSYRSGILVEALGHGPITCRAEACADAKRTWREDDDERRIEIGSASPNVRLSTVNGPLSVKELD